VGQLIQNPGLRQGIGAVQKTLPKHTYPAGKKPVEAPHYFGPFFQNIPFHKLISQFLVFGNIILYIFAFVKYIIDIIKYTIE
jgi:hypothetical protein